MCQAKRKAKQHGLPSEATADIVVQQFPVVAGPRGQSQTVFTIVDWGAVLGWILSFYQTADLLAMTKAMEKLPSGQNGIGSKNSRNAI